MSKFDNQLKKIENEKKSLFEKKKRIEEKIEALEKEQSSLVAKAILDIANSKNIDVATYIKTLEGINETLESEEK